MNIFGGGLDKTETLVEGGKEFAMKKASIMVRIMKTRIKGRGRRYFLRNEREMSGMLRCFRLNIDVR